MSWIAECRGLDRRVWALAAARMVVTAGFSMVMPFLAMHLAVDRKENVVVVGGIWFAAGALGALCQWAAGELADRVGRRPVMLAAMLARALNLLAMGYAIARQAPLWVIAGLTMANGALRGFFDPVATALVADLVPARARVSAYSLQRVGINIGWALGPAVATLAANLSYDQLFYASAPLTLLAAVGIWRIQEPARNISPRALTPRELLAFLSDRAFTRFLLATLAFYILQVQLYQTLSIYAASALHLTRKEVGWLYMLNGGLVVLLQLPAVGTIQRLGTRALLVGCLGYAASYAAVGLAGGPATLLLCIAGVTLAEIVTAPAQQSAVVTSLAPPGRTGAYVGLFGLCQVAGQSTGPLIGAALLAAIPPRAAWFALALFGIGAAVGYATVARESAARHNPLAREGQA